MPSIPLWMEGHVVSGDGRGHVALWGGRSVAWLDQVGLWCDWQLQWRSRRLIEIEVVDQIAQNGNILADSGARVRAAIGLRIEPLPMQEIVLDELEIRVDT